MIVDRSIPLKRILQIIAIMVCAGVFCSRDGSSSNQSYCKYNAEVYIDSLYLQAVMISGIKASNHPTGTTPLLEFIERAVRSRCDDFSPEEILGNISELFFSELDISFDSARSDINNLFPTTIYNSKSGNCLGLSLLFLLTAQRFELPVYGVMVPGHMFVRYDDGQTQINLEMMKKGNSYPDSWYKERYPTSEYAKYDLKNLAMAEVVGLLEYNLANYYYQLGRYDYALERYENVTGVLPHFAEAWGNYALTLGKANRPVKALESINTAVRLDPNLHYVNRNRGILLLQVGNFSEAVKELHYSVAQNPTDALAMAALGTAYSGLKLSDSSTIYLQKAGKIDPNISIVQNSSMEKVP